MADYNRGNYSSGADTFAFNGAAISLVGGDYTVPDTVKGIAVVAAGNIVFRAADGSSDITITGAPVGYIIPWHCSVIRQTGTTATLATLVGRA